MVKQLANGTKRNSWSPPPVSWTRQINEHTSEILVLPVPTGTKLKSAMICMMNQVSGIRTLGLTKFESIKNKRRNQSRERWVGRSVEGQKLKWTKKWVKDKRRCSEWIYKNKNQGNFEWTVSYRYYGWLGTKRRTFRADAVSRLITDSQCKCMST